MPPIRRSLVRATPAELGGEFRLACAQCQTRARVAARIGPESFLPEDPVEAVQRVIIAQTLSNNAAVHDVIVSLGGGIQFKKPASGTSGTFDAKRSCR